MKKICVIGGGRWGQNHIKTLSQSGHLAAIVESDPGRLSELLKQYDGIKGFCDLEKAIEAAYDGYIVATPAETHYLIGKQILENGLNVLIEKPMTLYSEQSKELNEIAQRTGATLMVGHVLLFHPAIRKIKELLQKGKIGKLHYLYSTRLNLGTVRTEENVFWSFAPHDISVLDYLIGQSAIRIEAKGSRFLQDKIYDVTMTQLEYPDNVHAHIFVSWLHPFKEQRLVLIGSNGMISFDDSSKEKEILFYNKHIDFVNGQPFKVEEPDEVIPYDKKAPLAEELSYFVENLGKPALISGGASGYEVVKILEEVQEIISK